MLARVLGMLAVAAAPLDPSNADAWRPPQPSSPVITWRLGKLFNAAFVQLDGALVISHNMRSPRASRTREEEAASGSTFFCRPDHFIELVVTNSTRRPSSARAPALCEALAGACGRGGAVVKLFAQLSGRPCQDALNFRANGPEDARLVQLGARRFAVMHNDFELCAPGADADCVRQPRAAAAARDRPPPPAFRRTIFVREVRLEAGRDGVLEARVGAARLVRPDRAGPPLASVEKNWAPFTPWAPGGGAEPPSPSLYFHRFLELRGRAIVQRLDLASGAIDATYTSSSGRLRALVGCPPHAAISGGTNGVRLNASHFVAVGHTMTAPCRLPAVSARGGEAARAECFAKRNGWRAYALFAYLFRAEPPFAIEAVTSEFRVEPPTAGAPGTALGPPTPAVSDPMGSVPDAYAQFPIGLALSPRRESLLLSTGYNDRETLLSRIDVRHLLERMQDVRVRSASAASSSSSSSTVG